MDPANEDPRTTCNAPGGPDGAICDRKADHPGRHAGWAYTFQRVYWNGPAPGRRDTEGGR